MKHYHLFLASMILLALCACSRETSFGESGEEVNTIQVIGPADIVFEEPATRGTEIINGSTLRFSWAMGDSLGIFPNKGNQVEFPITSTEGGTSAEFDGGGWGLKNGSSYAAYYPFSVWNYHRNNKTILLDYTGQVQDGNGNFAHLSAYDYLASSRETPESGKVTFVMSRLGAILYIDIVVPVATTVNSLVISCGEEIFTENAALDISGEDAVTTPTKKSKTLTMEFKNTITTAANETVRGYMAIYPLDFSGKTVYATLNTEAGEFGAAVVSKEVKQGKATFLRFSEGFHIEPEMVDLGLPSGIKWASFNLGATKPEEYGDYYAWGETEPYYVSLDPLLWKDGKWMDGYYWPSYTWCMGATHALTKYCWDSSSGYNGFTDDKTVLDPEDDAAQVNLGVYWRMPTNAEWQELIDNCIWTWTTQNGVNGMLVTASNGNSIFLPAAGGWTGTGLNALDSGGSYWSSSLSSDYSKSAWEIDFDSNVTGRVYYTFRCYGSSIRPVYAPVRITGITLNKTAIAFTAAGETDQLTATVAPSDATISTVTWSSSDNTVATVRSDGTVTAVGDGTATIIVTANDGSGVTAECKVTVGNIVFADENVKTICVANWDTNGDGELSYVEAAAVHSIGTVFRTNNDITSFDEFRFFSGLTSIVASAFSGCSGLTSIIIPDSVTHIGSQAFSGCSGLSSLILNEGLQALFTSAFSGCSGLTSIIIPDSVTSIGSSAFFGCSGLTSISIPDGVTSIGKSAFYNCSGLTSINIPDGVTRIESQTFYGCSGLSSLILNEGLQRINSSAFENCSSLKEVIFPSTITQLSGAFYASGIETIECYLNLLDEGLRTTSGLVLSKLSSAFFKNNTTTKESVKTIIIKKPNGTTTYPLPDYAFEGFSGAESISLPDGLTTIGYSAFKDCSSLLEAPVKESVTSIGPLAFYKCGGLTSIIIPDGVTSIGSQAFSGCSGLTSISVPAGVTSIGSQVFSGCSGLTSINIPDGVTSIGMGAFSGCSGLTSINIPDGVTSIGSSAFSGCSGLTSINIPDGMTSIESSAFSGCSGLTSINIPADVTSIGMQAFSGCSGLTSINIPTGVTGIGESAFSGCSALTSINIPAGVTSIGSQVFSGCSGLTSITIPAGVTSIGWRAFYGCGGLTAINIPDGVTSIGMQAFSGCSGLTAITCLPTVCPTAGYNIFDGSDCPIYVPSESVDAYKTAQNWSLYASRIQAIQ